MSEECVKALEILEKNATAEGRQHEADGHDITCKQDEMVCKATMALPDMNMASDQSKCFPAHKCKTENIRKELAESFEDAPFPVVMTFFQCGDEEPWIGQAPEAEGEAEGEAEE